VFETCSIDKNVLSFSSYDWRYLITDGATDMFFMIKGNAFKDTGATKSMTESVILPNRERFFSKAPILLTAKNTSHPKKTSTDFCRLYMTPVTHSRFESIYGISDI